MENKKDVCKHFVRFSEKNIDAIINFSDISGSRIYAECLVCNKELNDEEIIISLKDRHSIKIARLVYKYFICKRAYNRVALILEKNGIKNPVNKI